MRVFVSSTFSDMQEARDELVKCAFLRVRQIADQRSVAFHEVDLRWGIPQEASESGQVLPICLAEIDHCRPFFIGIIGSRYGTPVGNVMPVFSEQLRDQYPWLDATHLERSITEIEILYGALRPDHPPAHASFYLIETPDESVQPEYNDRLRALRAQIEQSGYPLAYYRDSIHLSQLVEADLSALIDQLFPTDTTPGPADAEERAQHQALLRLMRGSIERPDLIRTWDSALRGTNGPLAVIGEAGSGKSTLLAQWLHAQQLRPAQPSEPSLLQWLRNSFRRHAHQQATPLLTITHFVGVTIESANWASLVRRIMTQLKQQLGIELEIPEQSIALSASFSSWLNAAAERDGCTIVIDGLDHLDDHQQALDLGWLPEQVPANIRLIVSSSGGPSLSEMKRRGWATFAVTALTQAERTSLTITYLSQYRKALGDQHVRELVTAPQTANPLYLRLVLNELRVFGYHDELGERLRRYLEPATLRDLFGQFLSRLEKDYERERPGLVGDSLRLLSAARHGLREHELLDLLGIDDVPLAQALWTPLYLALQGVLRLRAGMLSPMYDDFGTVITERYMPTAGMRFAVHRHLATYFATIPAQLRVIEEIPWHLAAIHDWASLYTLLASPDYLALSWKWHQLELRAYWQMLVQASPYTMVDAYAQLEMNNSSVEAGIAAITLMGDSGHTREALHLANAMEQYARSNPDPLFLQTALSQRALLLAREGAPDEALGLLQEQEQICRSLGRKALVAACLGNQAAIWMQQGAETRALTCWQAEEVFCREIADFSGLATNQGNQAAVWFRNGDWEQAFKLLREQERIARQNGDLLNVHRSLDHQGLILRQQGQLPQALACHQQAEALFRRLGNAEGLQVCLGHQALVYQDLGHYDQALLLLGEKEQLSRQLHNIPWLIETLIQQADIYAIKIRQIKYATELLENALFIAREHHLEELSYLILTHLQSYRARTSQLR